MKVLVIYYSLEGNTKLIADTLAKTRNEMKSSSAGLEADTLRLEPVKDIKPKGFMRYVRGGKQVVMKETPVLKNFTINPNDYDLIILGTPVRAFNYAPAFRTFFQHHKIKNKKVALFCTHEGNAGKTLTNMKDRLPNNEIIATKDFLNVAKNRDKTIKEAKRWGEEITQTELNN